MTSDCSVRSGIHLPASRKAVTLAEGSPVLTYSSNAQHRLSGPSSAFEWPSCRERREGGARYKELLILHSGMAIAFTVTV